MTNEPIITSEWQWVPAARPSPQHAIYEQLIWRGMILGAVEAFRESGPVYGNIGTGRSPLDYNYRTGPVGSVVACRRLVEGNVRRALNEGLGAFASPVKGEPVAWLRCAVEGDAPKSCNEDDDGAFPVYRTTPDTGVGATREALEDIDALGRHLRQGGPDPMDLQELSDALDDAVSLANGALLLAAANQSDGGAKAGSSPVLANKEAVEAVAIREALIAAKCDSGDGTYVHCSMDQVVGALLAKFKMEGR